MQRCTERGTRITLTQQERTWNELQSQRAKIETNSVKTRPCATEEANNAAIARHMKFEWISYTFSKRSIGSFIGDKNKRGYKFGCFRRWTNGSRNFYETLRRTKMNLQEKKYNVEHIINLVECFGKISTWQNFAVAIYKSPLLHLTELVARLYREFSPKSWERRCWGTILTTWWSMFLS